MIYKIINDSQNVFRGYFADGTIFGDRTFDIPMEKKVSHRFEEKRSLPLRVGMCLFVHECDRIIATRISKLILGAKRRL